MPKWSSKEWFSIMTMTMCSISGIVSMPSGKVGFGRDPGLRNGPGSVVGVGTVVVPRGTVVPIVPASTATVRTRVECDTNRASHASCEVWKMSKPKRSAHGIRRTTAFSPSPTPLPPVSVKRTGRARSAGRSSSGG